MEVEKQKIKAEIPEKGPDIQQKEPRKRKGEAQEIGYAVKGYWIKEKKRVKDDGVEKEVTVIKDSVFSTDVSLPKDSDVVKDIWGFIRSQLTWTSHQSKRRHLMPIFIPANCKDWDCQCIPILVCDRNQDKIGSSQNSYKKM